MSVPWLVLIDLQFDFYHPGGVYGRTGRPLAPFQKTLSYLKTRAIKYPRVLRVGSIYSTDQWSDMPGLCTTPKGCSWCPELRRGRLIIKRQQSCHTVLQEHFKRPVPVVIGGFCTHRCVRSTVHKLISMNWPVKVLEPGVASCGHRQSEHENCLRTWRQQGSLIETLFPKQRSPDFKAPQLMDVNPV